MHPKFLLICFVISILFTFLGIYFTKTQSKIFSAKYDYANAISELSLLLMSRWNNLKSLAQESDSYPCVDYEVLINEINAKYPKIIATTVYEITAQIMDIANITTKLFIVYKDYPEIVNYDSFIKLVKNTKSYEDKLNTKRILFNNTANNYNKLIEKFPNNLVARYIKAYPVGILSPVACKVAIEDVFKQNMES